MKRTLGLLSVALTTIAAGDCGTVAAAPPPRQPNVLFIAVDDLNWRIDCYGDPIVRTPNLDRLARNGSPLRAGLLPVPAVQSQPALAPVGTLSDDHRDDRLRLSGTAGPRLGHAAGAFSQRGYEVRLLGKVWHFDKDLMKNWFHEEVPGAESTAGATGEKWVRRSQEVQPACWPI